MTTTDTTSLAEILSAKKADLNGQPEPDVIEADIVTGEIVPVSAAVSPTSEPGGSPSLAPAAAPAPVDVDYSFTPAKVLGAIPFAEGYWRMARRVAPTEFVPKDFRGNPTAIVAAFMRGYEMGFPPMQSLASFNVIEGKVGLTAEAMRALIMEAGHRFILSEEPGVAYVTCRRSDWPESIPDAVYRYDLEDAKIAGLLRPSKSGRATGWDKNPRAMLSARATSGAARAYFADVLAGMSYTPEEIKDFSPEQEVTPSPPTTPPPVDSAPSTAISTPPSSSKSTPVDPSSSDPPKRPRGRPRKATTPPKDAPGLSASETSTTAPEPVLTTVPSTPPELISLNDPKVLAGDSPGTVTVQGSVAGPTSAGEIGVTREMLKTLTQIIKGLPTAQQVPCRGFIRQHFPEGSDDLSPADVQKCIDIAAGWPDSEAQHPVPVTNEPLPF